MLGGLLDGLLCPIVREGGVGIAEPASTWNAGDAGPEDGGGVARLFISLSIAEFWRVDAFFKAITCGLMTSTNDSHSLPLSWLSSFSASY